MKPAGQGYQVGVSGASSLLGQELVRVLNERSFPVSRLVTFEADEAEPDLPIVDLAASLESEVASEEVPAAELDFIFLAECRRSVSGLSPLLRPALEAARLSAPGQDARCVIVDMEEACSESAEETSSAVSSIPFLERAARDAQPASHTRLFTSMHPAAITLSALALRLGARFPLKSVVAQVFSPVSELGPSAIDELQRQTTSLLSFQKVPQKTFGAQLAFNLLAHLGSKRDSDLVNLECRVRKQVGHYLAGRVPIPAVKVTQVPVFYSLAFSVYVETTQEAAPEMVEAALAGEHLRVRRHGESAPSPVDAAGSGDILVDSVTRDPAHHNGFWIWAAVDNIRLAAENAVEIAQSLTKR